MKKLYIAYIKGKGKLILQFQQQGKMILEESYCY